MASGETAEDAFFREFGEAYAELRQGFGRYVGLSAQRVQILVRLHRDGETSHSALRRFLGIDGASVTRLVKDLEAEELVVRRPDPADNRYTLAALTPGARRLAAELERTHQAYQRRLLDGVGAEERDVFVRVLRQVRANLNGMEPG